MNGFNINTNNSFEVTNTTLFKTFILAVVIFIAYFLIKKTMQ